MAEISKQLKSRAIQEWNERCIKLIDWAEGKINLLDEGRDTETIVGIDLAVELLQAEERIAELEARLAALETRYAIPENQRLCLGYPGGCDGNLEGTEHEQECPARVRDLELRPYLYNPPRDSSQEGENDQ